MSKKKSPAFVIAFCGIMIALGVVIMLTGGLTQVMTYASPLLAGLFLIPVMEELSEREGWLVWVGTSVLSLLLSADKEAGCFYLFLGYYPLVKPHLDRLGKGLRLLSKIGLFATATLVMYGLLHFLIGLDLGMEEMDGSWWLLIVFFVVLVATMLIYDKGLINMRRIYRELIRPKFVGK